MASAYFYMLFPNDRVPRKVTERTRRKLRFADYDDVKGNMSAFVQFMFKDDAHGEFRFNWSEFVFSWIDREAAVLKYEDMLRDAVGTVAEAILHVTGQEVDRNRLAVQVDRFSFEKVANRKPGREDRSSFARKGIVGDWRNTFSKDACQVFDRLGGDALIRAGYEANNDWVEEFPE